MKIIKTPNSRLLYKKFSSLPLFWGDVSEDIKDFIKSVPALQFANEKFYIYFFSPSKDFGESIPCWGATEVIGHVDEDFLAENDLFSYDLESGQVIDFLMESQSVSDLNSMAFFEKERELREKSSEELAPTWRVALDFETLSKSEFQVKASIQLFLL